MSETETIVDLEIVSATFRQMASQTECPHPAPAYAVRVVAGERPFRPAEVGISPPTPHNQMTYSLAGRREQFVDLARKILADLEPTTDRILDKLCQIEARLDKQSPS